MYTMCGVGTDVLGKQSAVVTIGYPLSAFGHRIVLHITAVTTTARNTMYNSRLVSIAGRVLVAIAMSTHPDAGAALGTAGHTATQAEARAATCLFPHNPLELVGGVDSQAGANAQLWFPGLCARREGTASSPTVVPMHPLRVEVIELGVCRLLWLNSLTLQGNSSPSDCTAAEIEKFVQLIESTNKHYIPIVMRVVGLRSTTTYMGDLKVGKTDALRPFQAEYVRHAPRDAIRTPISHPPISHAALETI